MRSIDTLGDWLLPILELGHSDLLFGFYRAKFSFLMYTMKGHSGISVSRSQQQLLKSGLNSSTNLSQASNQAVFGVLLFAFVGSNNIG